MARIRTIKPEFFTSEDIVSLNPLARLLYIAMWCESDKEGRMAWKPKTFKMRYFPADECDINVLCKEITDAGLVKLYGGLYAYIPAFHAHQHINPRESASQLPSPDIDLQDITRQPRVEHASTTRQSRDSDTQVGREGKGREGIDTRVEHADKPAADKSADLPPGFAKFWETWPSNDRKQAKGKCLDAWKKAHAERDAALVIDHVQSLKNGCWQKDGGQFVPAPLTYLNGRRWEGAEAANNPMQSGIFAGAI